MNRVARWGCRVLKGFAALTWLACSSPAASTHSSAASTQIGGVSTVLGSGSPFTTSTSPAATPKPAQSDLSGTWDIIASGSSGRADTATVTLSSSLLTIKEQRSLSVLISDGGADIAFDGSALSATRSAAPNAKLGIMPLPLTGSLHFSDVPDTGVGCDYSLGATALSFSCTGGVARPYGLPRLAHAKVMATRIGAGASVFGDVGGRWNVVAGNAKCEAQLEGNSITITCDGASEFSGQIKLSVNGDRVSGTTSGGGEFTAQRR